MVDMQHTMNWQQLISNKRLGQEHRHPERHDVRTEFKVFSGTVPLIIPPSPSFFNPPLAPPVKR